MTDAAALGRVVELRSFPVKSMDAIAQNSAEVTADGLAGDRRYAVVDLEGRPVSARRFAALLDVRAIDGPAGPLLQLPDRGDPVEGADADAALSAYLGVPVRTERVSRPAHQVAPLHLVSRQAMARASGPGCEDAPGDLAAPRANVTIDLAGATETGPGLERDWIGRTVALGDVIVRITTAPRHCLGVYAEVVTSGRLRVGDVVASQDPLPVVGAPRETSATGQAGRG